MFTAAEIFDALRRRQLKSNRPTVAGQLPPGWHAWLAAMPQRSGAITGASAAGIIDCLMRRPLRELPVPGLNLNRWQAFATLWRQQWHPSTEDGRWLRIGAAVASLLIHLLLTVVLAWLMYLRLFAMPVPVDASVVKVQYIGEGTPESMDVPVPSPRETPTPPVKPERARVPASAPTRPPKPVIAMLPEPEITPLSIPTPALEINKPQLSPQPLRPTVPQPLSVTQAPQPDSAFVLPPPNLAPPEWVPPTLVVPEPSAPEIRIEDTRIKPVKALALPTIRKPELQTPRIPLPTPAPIQPPSPAKPQPVTIAEQALDIPEIASKPIRELPQPSLPEVSLPSPTAVTAPSLQQPARPVTGSSQQAIQDAEPNAPESPPADATPAAPADAWSTVTRSDDWGEALRNQPGSQTGQPPGLFDKDGRPRLAGGTQPVKQGAVPGSAQQQAVDLERAGTWLKRPPYDYTPTSFDRFWIPGGSLLEEWVRRGIKEMSIPIPGTSKHINCVVSLLQLGGGCSLSDDDLKDHPATARPPPDIPFKPELQENQESLRQDG